MQTCLVSLLAFLRSLLQDRAARQIENPALRHQLNVLLRTQQGRVPLNRADRIFWVWLSKVWSNWRSALVIVNSETVISWHRKGFRLYWTWESRSRCLGRPTVSQDVRDLIRKMSIANPLWGVPRIHGELLKLGIDVAESTVAKYKVRHRSVPSQTWRTFLKNHAIQLVPVDFFVVPTLNFWLLFVFVVLEHHRRRVVHFNVTDHPTAEWTAQQIREAFPWDKAPRFLIRDRDGCYGDAFRQTVRGMNIEEVLTALRSPWQNGFAERLIGSIRMECLDHVIVLNEASLRKILRSYFRYYERTRTHLALGKDPPESARSNLPNAAL